MCSANPKTTERFDADEWRTFDGRALAVVRPTAVGRAAVSVCGASDAAVRIDLDVIEAGEEK